MLVKKAVGIFNLILYIFEKSKCKGRGKEECYAAMINPFTLNIVTRKKDLLIDKFLYIHETCHIIQVKRDGRIKFLIKYLFFNLKYGYYNNPYEVEARNYAEFNKRETY